SFFDAETIKDIIMFRHKTGNLELVNTKGENIGAIGKARLFSNIFNFSSGNINSALFLWLNSIDEINNDKIKVKNLKQIDTSVLLNLQNDWYIVLVQLILHKRLNKQSLENLLLKSEIEISELIDSLLRTGLVIEEKQNAFIINPQLYVYIKKVLIEKNMI
ncbi:MAG: hypothetical protein U9R54_09490, partial [Bacteroidota bacterium]|nr:hypothetical protein [Bacteroidota bacterium]